MLNQQVALLLSEDLQWLGEHRHRDDFSTAPDRPNKSVESCVLEGPGAFDVKHRGFSCCPNFFGIGHAGGVKGTKQTVPHFLPN
jgi:hypothetical protein